MPNLLLRVLSALVLIPGAVALIVFAPPAWFALAATLLAAICGFEFGCITAQKPLRRVRFLSALLAASCCAAVSFGPHSAHPSAFFAATLLIAPASLLALMFHPAEHQLTVRAAAFTATGALYCGGLWGFVSLTRSLDDFSGWRMVLVLFAAAVFTDTSAYAVGRLLGKRRLAPRISPKKTWAGAGGGLAGALGAVVLARAFLLPDLSWSGTALLGALLGIFLQLGDLLESFVKRGFDVKDSGNLIPGHGGLLDRVDALLLGAPVVYLFSLWH